MGQFIICFIIALVAVLLVAPGVKDNETGEGIITLVGVGTFTADGFIVHSLSKKP